MPVSSARITSIIFVLLLLVAHGVAQSPHGSASDARSADGKTADPALFFQRGEQALKENNLGTAESAFRQVLAIDPRAGAAYANLGVVYIRRRQWGKALEALHKAQDLMPNVAGIRLNVGLAYYRQNEFLKAI